MGEIDYKLIKDWLMPGDLKTICGRFGVSKSTASLVLKRIRADAPPRNLPLYLAIEAKAAENRERVESGRKRLKSIGA